MPYATANDGVRLYYEEAGSGVPLVFVHEFAADYASWEPQMRYFARRHRCVTFSARGYTPSDIPADVESYGYDHFRTDIVALLDHLKIDKAHIVGLSMGAYSTLQAGIHHADRALSLTLAGIGSGSEREFTAEFRKLCLATADSIEQTGAATLESYGLGPVRIPFMVKDPRGYREFADALARHDLKGAAMTLRGFQGGRPSVYDFEDAIRDIVLPVLIISGDEDDPCLAPSLFLKARIAASGLAIFPKSGHTVNLEEPALFNATLERFLGLAEAGRWAPRDPRSQNRVY